MVSKSNELDWIDQINSIKCYSVTQLHFLFSTPSFSHLFLCLLKYEDLFIPLIQMIQKHSITEVKKKTEKKELRWSKETDITEDRKVREKLFSPWLIHIFEGRKT